MPELKSHPIAEPLPEMDMVEYSDLVVSVRQNGLLQPIVLFEGMILDGRHRYRACCDTGVEPRFEGYEGDEPAAYALAVNVNRRNLQESQRATVAAELVQMGNDLTVDRAARLANVSPRTVKHATKVLKSGDKELIGAVKKGDVRVSKAAKHVSEKAKPGGPPKDALGRELRSDLVEAFAITAEIKKTMSLVESARQQIKKLKDLPGAAYLRSQQITADLTNAKEACKFALPYTICPGCKGSGCRDCQNVGYMAKQHYERLPEGKQWATRA